MTLVAPDILQKIRSKGHWRVNIRPTMFEKEHIPTLARCSEIMESSSVRLRGWPYPYIRDENIIRGQDWIECSLDREDIEGVRYIEYWRLYQSGQFIHYFGCPEDWIPRKHWRLSRLGEPISPEQPFLDILSTIFSLAEIFEFAARLAVKEVLIPGGEVNIKLIGMENRRLVFSDPSRGLTGEYRANILEVEFQKIFSAVDLLSRPRELALDAVEYVFERFNLTSVPRDIWAMDQARLLERRL